jgi:hypothetical protein
VRRGPVEAQQVPEGFPVGCVVECAEEQGRALAAPRVDAGGGRCVRRGGCKPLRVDTVLQEQRLGTVVATKSGTIRLRNRQYCTRGVDHAAFRPAHQRRRQQAPEFPEADRFQVVCVVDQGRSRRRAMSAQHEDLVGKGGDQQIRLPVPLLPKHPGERAIGEIGTAVGNAVVTVRQRTLRRGDFIAVRW